MPLVFEIFEDSETEISKYVIKSFAIARMMIWNMLLAFESFIATENDVLEYAVCLMMSGYQRRELLWKRVLNYSPLKSTNTR